ncbi:MAG: hypothetical protein OXM55_07435 [Bdellovibrionales bacterium]|nr:hypothetical protein [Bdellovibrionales bacterium]
MNSLICKTSDIKKELNYKGILNDFKKSEELINYLIEKRKIVSIANPHQINKSLFKVYSNHLFKLTKEYCEAKNIKSWEHFCAQPETNKVTKILWSFGIKGAYFSSLEEQSNTLEQSTDESISLEDIHYIAEVHYGFKGSTKALQSQLQRDYGSVAEFCLEYGLPLNASSWEKSETAIRVAKKIGSISQIEKKSPSLLKFLETHKLLEELNLPIHQSDFLIYSLLSYVCNTDKDLFTTIVEQWFIISNYGELSEDIPDVILKLKDSLSPQELGILYHDLQKVLSFKEDSHDIEKIVDMAFETWQTKMVSFAEQANVFSKKLFKPNTESQAIGYLIFQMISIDGQIHHDEILQFRNHLSSCKPFKARSVLAGVNFSLHNNQRNSILDFEHLLGKTKEREEAILNCCSYLKKNSLPAVIEQVLTLLKIIMKADNYIHKNEKWLMELIDKNLNESNQAA